MKSEAGFAYVADRSFMMHMTQTFLSPRAMCNTPRQSLTPGVENPYEASLMPPKVVNSNTIGLHKCEELVTMTIASPFLRIKTLLAQQSEKTHNINECTDSGANIAHPKAHICMQRCLHEDDDKGFYSAGNKT